MGGRGAGAGGRYGGGGGLSMSDILETTSFVSTREGNAEFVDEVLSVSSDIYNEYGFQINDFDQAKIKPGKNAIAYYDGSNIGWNEAFANKKALEASYAATVKSGFHPSNGKKTAAQAVAAHEFGHALNDVVGKKLGVSLDVAATRIVEQARKQTRHKGVVKMAHKISTYATHNNAETIAEAFADVYCNGSKAKKESRAVVNVLNSYLK